MDKCHIEIKNLINLIITSCCDEFFVSKIKLILDFKRIELLIIDDLDAFSKRDPAAKNEPRNILFGYTSFSAILHYRLAHAIINTNMPKEFDQLKYQYALFISSKGKLQSGAEIHPAAQVGERFVLDHGFGTVIGETTQIGNDCYVLGGVVLGAMGISGNKEVRRHPRVGNNVQIGSFSRVFGTVSIGDNVFIDANCTIVDDIPEYSIVTLKSEIQITTRNSHHACN